jgi:tetratricopeptide (TPR) repeat protein
MTRIMMFLLGLTTFLPWASCGGEGRAAREYGDLRNGGLRGEELVAALEDFELRHPDHFYSKVDLGTYYLARGEEGRAGDYLRRAEAIAALVRRDREREKLRAGGGKEGEENYLSIMYGALGRIYLARGDRRQALEYAEKAIEHAEEKAGAYRLLKGHILIAQGEYDKALEIFDGAFSGGPGGGAEEPGSPAAVLPEAEAGDILAYLFLLAQAERSADAAAVLNRYFETGAFFPSLGTFAAMVYRAAGEMERAAYAVYLEEEYRSGYGEGGKPAALEIPRPGGNFFAGEYLAIKDEINRGSLSEAQFLRYLELEAYFRLFPSYYWNLWLGARLVYPESYGNFAPALQKIISLDKDGPFAREAWKALSSLLGY